MQNVIQLLILSQQQNFKNLDKMEKKNNFLMWLSDFLFSDKTMRVLNWLAIILLIVWFGYHGLRFIFNW